MTTQPLITQPLTTQRTMPALPVAAPGGAA
jgi:hypothetical protein